MNIGRLIGILLAIFTISQGNAAESNQTKSVACIPMKYCDKSKNPPCHTICVNMQIVPDISGRFSIQLNDLEKEQLPEILKKLGADRQKIEIPK